MHSDKCSLAYTFIILSLARKIVPGAAAPFVLRHCPAALFYLFLSQLVDWLSGAAIWLCCLVYLMRLTNSFRATFQIVTIIGFRSCRLVDWAQYLINIWISAILNFEYKLVEIKIIFFSDPKRLFSLTPISHVFGFYTSDILVSRLIAVGFSRFDYRR